MPYRLRNLALEPYRLFFTAGSLYAIVAVGIWFTWLHALDHSIILFNWLEPPHFIHAHVMLYGVIGLYVFGFILTAFPRFVEQPLPNPKWVFSLWLAFLLSQVFLVIGTFTPGPWMVLAGIFEALSYLALWVTLARLYLRSGNFRQNKQPAFLLIALLFGAAGVILSYLYYGLHLDQRFYTLSVEVGTYGYLLLLIVAITYRVVPFFTGKIIADYVPRRGKFTLEIVLALIVLRIGLMVSLSPSLIQNYLSWALNLVLLGVLAREWWSWLPKKMAQAPMLKVLYLGLTWVLIFLGFSAYEIIVHLLRPDAPVFPVIYTPALHALYVGCFGTLLLGISTRVVRGHGGLPIVADKMLLAALLSIQLAAVLRVVIPLLGLRWPGLIGQNYWAGFFWCVAF
ncbi:MAG: NnrS family protein, partial [bacterium]|nr:NnrS family protein [bacterium]